MFRRKTRTIFTLLSVLAAFVLFGMLDSVRTAFADANNNVAGADRMLTMSKISFTIGLPKSMLERIKAVDGVKDVATFNWFGGVYQDPKNFFPNGSVSPNYLDLYPEFLMPADQREAFNNTRTGAVVGKQLADKFGWKVGDKIPLQATIYPQANGSNAWTFDLVGIFHVSNPKDLPRENNFYFHWEYFDEAARFGKGAVGWYIVKLNDRNAADAVGKAIDALFANSDHETKTEDENAFFVSFLNQFADFGLIVTAIMAAVFFTLVLLTGNTMAQAVRERIPELAVLKTIGFSNRSVLALVLAESVLLIVLGGVIGLGFAYFVVEGVKLLVTHSPVFIPIQSVDWRICAEGFALMIVIGLVVGALPAMRGMRLRIVDALAGR